MPREYKKKNTEDTQVYDDFQNKYVNGKIFDKQSYEKMLSYPKESYDYIKLKNTVKDDVKQQVNENEALVYDSEAHTVRGILDRPESHSFLWGTEQCKLTSREVTTEEIIRCLRQLNPSDNCPFWFQKKYVIR